MTNKRELGVSYSKIGDVEASLGNGQEAYKFFIEAQKIFKALSDRNPKIKEYRDLLNNINEKIKK